MQGLAYWLVVFSQKTPAEGITVHGSWRLQVRFWDQWAQIWPETTLAFNKEIRDWYSQLRHEMMTVPKQSW